ncbi:hypothetical protein CLOSTMETH_03647 [[Clostridium] methylpentosum DSM 5476]|uniref:Uncharacterized protein n=1 Tax=[Clostridium] methylpentosum DSM 5476 TaxID=537013 RepID=C0EIF2_9FIRM|nr:hypothetical protein CLOSTMETH_03647 [[Clostridium] methylpentosum DSM 5476]
MQKGNWPFGQFPFYLSAKFQIAVTLQQFKDCDLSGVAIELILIENI